MITLLLGRSGSGKTGKIIDAMAENARQGDRGQLLIVPPQFTHETERRLCLRAGDSVCSCAEVLSFERLCQRVFAHTGGGGRRSLDLPGRLLIMRLALKSVEGSLQVYSGLSRPHGLKSALEMVDELKSCAITPAALEEAAEKAGGSLGKKLNDAALILAAYDALLETGVSDRLHDMERLCRALEGSDFAAGRKVFVDGFGWFTALEQECLYLLVRGGAELTVSVTWDEEDEAFQLQRRALGAVRRIAERTGSALDIRWEEKSGGKHPCLDHIEKNLFAHIPEKFTGDRAPLRLYTAEDTFTECRLAAARAVELVKKEGLRWRDIVVACRGMENYAPMLERVFAWEGVPLFVSAAASLDRMPECAFLLSSLEAAESGWRQEDVIAALKTGLGALEPEELDILENYARMWQIQGSFWTRKQDWLFNPDGLSAPETEDTALRLEHINTLRRRVRRPLAVLQEAAEKTAPAESHARALYEFFTLSQFPEKLQLRQRQQEEAGFMAQAARCGQIWGILCSVLDESVEILAGEELEFSEYAGLLRLMLSGCTVGAIPPSLDCVTASDISLLGQKDIRALILIGADESALPAVTDPPGLFTPGERRGLSALDMELGGAEDRLIQAENSYIYSVFAKPKHSVTVSRPLVPHSGEAGAPSFVFTRLAEMFDIEIQEFSRWQEIDGVITAAGVQRLARSGAPGAREAAELLAQRGVLPPPEQDKKTIGQAAAALYGKEIFLTASRAERFALCPFSFFMEYGLKARPERPAAFDAPEIGVFTHWLLENVLREAGEKGGIRALSAEQVDALADKYTEIYISDTLSDFADKSPRFIHLFLRQAKSAKIVAADMAAELSRGRFSPEMFELKFGLGEDSLPAVSMKNDAVSLKLAGVADRVDLWRHEGRVFVRVVDYKTGTKDFHLSDLSHGLNMQLLIYLFALAGRGQELFGAETVSAGALYCPAYPAQADAKNSLASPGQSAALQRSGIVLMDGQVIDAMEENIDGKGVYLPVKVSGDTISGSVASAAEMELLSRLITDVSLNIAQRIAAGHIAPEPKISGQKNPCDWCPYAASCGTGGKAGRKIERVKDGDFWCALNEKYGVKAGEEESRG